jgi:subtilase family serine protease
MKFWPQGEVMLRPSNTSLLVWLSFVFLASSASSAQSLSPLTRHVREQTLNGEARSLGRLSSNQTLRLVLILPLRNEAALDAFLQELYNPSSRSYRDFLSVEQFTQRFGPSQQDYDSLIHFAEANGFQVVGRSRNRLNVDVVGSVATIEKTFHLTMGVYMHPSEGRIFYAPDREPTVDLALELWHISGLDSFSVPRPALGTRNELHSQPNATTGSGPGASFLGSDMRAAYYGGSLTGLGQSLGLVEFGGTDLADLNAYYKNVGQTNMVTITRQSVDGTSVNCYASSGCDDTEQTLDMTQALGMAPGMSSLVMYIGSPTSSTSDAAVFNAMATASPLNAQLSSSWTWSPADPGTDDPYFKEFAAQGQNLFQAAGDSGAWGKNSNIFPADDVYVTSVGGTDLASSGAGGPWHSETAWVDGGGGISPDKYAIPSWQTAAAAGCASCSSTYRNAPDVSANANFTFYVCADQTACTANLWGGTSFAAPMWAGYLALVNEQAVRNGNKPVGFINPSLYSIGESSSYSSDFHDITGGSDGHAATTGYDLATGWGSPNGSGLINALAGNSAAGVTFSPTALSFGPQVSNTASAAKPVTLTSSGGGTLNISSITTAAPFAISSKTCGATLIAGAKCKVYVTFTPTALGKATGVLSFGTNAPDSPQSEPLSGNGVEPATLTPTKTTYTKQTVGTTSPAKTFTVTNYQTVSLTGIGISTTGDFAVSATTCTATLGAKSKCTISVTFKPTATGTRTGSLEVSDSASDSPQISMLTGTGD